MKDSIVRKIFLVIPCLLLALVFNPPSTRALAPSACYYSTATADILECTTSDRYYEWIRQFSGAAPVQVSGVSTTINTRYSPQLFNGTDDARAFDFLLQQVQEWHYSPYQVEVDEFTHSYSNQTWKNLVVTIPGQVHPEQVVVLSAHLDDYSDDPFNIAPGAEDNASGVAALMEAARLFRLYQFEKTIKLIWFTGEEQGMLGSKAYVKSHDLTGYVGVVNLDMFGYDHDADRCFEMHVGSLAASDVAGQCAVHAISAYGLNLTFDYIQSGAIRFSDHSPFWDQGVGAIEVLENHYFQSLGGCAGRIDVNPSYHKTLDTFTNSFTSDVAFDIARTGLAAISDLAGPIGACFDSVPVLIASNQGDAVKLNWKPLLGAYQYRLYRSFQGINGPWSLVAIVSDTNWVDKSVIPGQNYVYTIEAVADDETCVSGLSKGAFILTPGFKVFLPQVKR